MRLVAIHEKHLVTFSTLATLYIGYESSAKLSVTTMGAFATINMHP